MEQAIAAPTDVSRYNQLLKIMLEEQKDVVNSLAQGFKESAKYIKDEEIIARFLNKTLSSKLAVRMLVTHHLHLQDKKAGWIGLINLNMSLHDMVERWVRFAADVAEEQYGHCPRIKISGHIGAHFPYIETPLDYILPELLKNAVRATIEHNSTQTGASLPPVHVILATSTNDFMIKVSCHPLVATSIIIYIIAKLNLNSIQLKLRLRYIHFIHPPTRPSTTQNSLNSQFVLPSNTSL